MPRPYCSYSQVSLWYKDKNAYIRRYFLNEKQKDTEYTLFGKETHDLIAKDPQFKDIQFSEYERKVEATVAGVKVMGYIDALDLSLPYLCDYKTSKNQWTQLDVEKLMQLDVYSLLLKLQYGITVKNVGVVWLETAWEEEVLKGSSSKIVLSKKLVLTGKRKRFERKIYERDRKAAKKWLEKAITEISEAWEEYKNKK